MTPTSIRLAVAALLCAPLVSAIPASAQFSGQPTCYDRFCKRVDRTNPVEYRGTDNPGMTIESRTGMTATLTRTELRPIHVDIPEPPYGTVGSGTCIVRFHVTEDGAVETPTVANCPEPYANTLHTSAKTWRYHPLTDADADGTPIPTRHATLHVPWKSWQVTVSD